MNIQASTTSISAAMPTLGAAQLSTPATQEATKTTNSDSVTISAQGLDMFKQTQAASSEALEAVNDLESKDDSATLKTVLEGTSSTEEEDDTTSSTTDLSSLSDAQIAQKVADGEITQAEADAELAARKNKETIKNISTNSEAATSIDVLI